MTAKTRPLLCELHAHTTWSDGALSLVELVDLYGTHGFDVLDDASPVREDRGGRRRSPSFVAPGLRRSLERVRPEVAHAA